MQFIFDEMEVMERLYDMKVSGTGWLCIRSRFIQEFAEWLPIFQLSPAQLKDSAEFIDQIKDRMEALQKNA